MSVAEHLGIKTSEYDAQILTFIPYYDEILDRRRRRSTRSIGRLGRSSIWARDRGRWRRGA